MRPCPPRPGLTAYATLAGLLRAYPMVKRTEMFAHCNTCRIAFPWGCLLQGQGAVCRSYNPSFRLICITTQLLLRAWTPELWREAYCQKEAEEKQTHKLNILNKKKSRKSFHIHINEGVKGENIIINLFSSAALASMQCVCSRAAGRARFCWAHLQLLCSFPA